MKRCEAYFEGAYPPALRHPPALSIAIRYPAVPAEAFPWVLMISLSPRVEPTPALVVPFDPFWILPRICVRVSADMAKLGDFVGAIQIASDSMPKLILFIFDDLCCMLHTCLVKSIVCKADSCRIQFDTEGTQSSAADLSYEGDISKWSYLSRVTDFDILWTCIRAYILRAPARIYIYIINI